MQAGRRTKHSGQNVCEMVGYSNVLLCNIRLQKMTAFAIFKFAAGSGPHTSQHHRDRNMETRCWHWPEEMAGGAAG
ncbi:unnamed protein product, partial [Staurois parvus]